MSAEPGRPALLHRTQCFLPPAALRRRRGKNPELQHRLQVLTHVPVLRDPAAFDPRDVDVLVVAGRARRRSSARARVVMLAAA